MKQEATLIRARLKTPRAAAIAGILFSVLLITGLLLFRLSVRADPLEAGTWLKTSSNRVALALNLVPFAGIAFLWFIGVLRDRLGELEDRFFATVLLGSGLLFLAMLFASASVAGGIIIAKIDCTISKPCATQSMQASNTTSSMPGAGANASLKMIVDFS
jgi:hypothetical protein